MTGLDFGTAAKAVGPVQSLVKWLWHFFRPDTSQRALATHADDLAAEMIRRETRLLENLGALHGPSAMSVDFEVQWGRNGAADPQRRAQRDAGTFYAELEAPRRLVVIGRPGSGKTVLTAFIALSVLRARQEFRDQSRTAEKVPIRLNASGWDGASDFSEFMVSAIHAQRFGLRKRVIRKLVDDGWLFPVLDGLDEMDQPEKKPSKASKAIKALNAVPWNTTPVIVSCHESVFDQLLRERGDSGVHNSTRIRLQPLQITTVEEYLNHYRVGLGIPADQWAPALDVLHGSHSVLAKALRSPWLLNLAARTLAYNGLPAAHALADCATVDEVSDLLFRNVVPAAIDSTLPARRASNYTEKNIDHWLLSLAQYFEREASTGGDRTLLYPYRTWRIAGAVECRTLSAFVSGLVVVLLAILCTEPVRYAIDRVTVNNEFGRSYNPALLGLYWSDTFANTGVWGLAAGVVVALVLMLPRSPKLSIAPASFKRLMVATVAFGILELILVATIHNYVTNATVAYPLKTALLIDLIALLLWTSIPASLWVSEYFLRRTQTSYAGYFWSNIGPIYFGLVVGHFIFLLALPRSTQLYSLDGSIISTPAPNSILWQAAKLGLIAALLVFVIIRPIVSPPYLHDFAATLIFASLNTFPVRSTRFLDWATDRGIMRKSGVGYQFRHESYQHWILDR